MCLLCLVLREDASCINVPAFSAFDGVETELLRFGPGIHLYGRKKDKVSRIRKRKLSVDVSNEHGVTFIYNQNVLAEERWALLELLPECVNGQPFKDNAWVCLFLLLRELLPIVLN